MPGEANLAAGAGRPAEPALRATYRLQLHAGFDFDAARGVVDYLSELGISHAYLSPCLTAIRGSTHGYDVANPSRISEELGGHAAHDAFSRALRDHGMGQIIDIVPNHMAASVDENPWWRELLENGVRGRHGRHFDVDWAAPDGVPRLHLPVLGEPLEECVRKGLVHLARHGGTIVLRVHGAAFPITPRCVSYLDIARRSHESLDDVLARYNDSPELLARVLDAQNYVLHEWREGAKHRNYRRFFDVDSLVALNAHHDEVFADSHVVVARWLGEGAVSGVRVDHVDGLRDPAGYLDRLYALSPSAHVLVEKILGRDECLPPELRAAGTTGYDFLNRLEGLFVDPEGERPLTELYAQFTGVQQTFDEVAYDSKHLVMRTSLAADVERLVRALGRECTGTRWFEVPAEVLRAVVSEYIACLPVYRTYFRPGHASPGDVAVVRRALAATARRLPEVEPAFLDFVAGKLVNDAPDSGEFMPLLQQTSGAVMAKGVEDTAFYRYLRFVALNEVGGDPGVFGTPVDAFHAATLAVLDLWPETMTTTATHDTKRGEDVRARLSLLSQIPGEWERRVRRWSELTLRHRDARLDPNDEYRFYQTLVGAFPLSKERAVEYTRKALREAKRHTSWTDPDAEYEDAAFRFVRGMLSDADCMNDVAEFVARLLVPGRVTSIAKKLVALTAPGIPDVYQGTELWDHSLVDPDNRRPVDYDERRRLLAACSRSSPEEIWAAADSGLPKLRVVQAGLSVRRRFPRAFGRGSTYTPLGSAGAKGGYVVAFARGEDVVVAVPRLAMKLEDGWGDTTVALPPGAYVNELTGDTVPRGAVRAETLFRRFPVALLTRAP